MSVQFSWQTTCANRSKLSGQFWAFNCLKKNFRYIRFTYKWKDTLQNKYFYYLHLKWIISNFLSYSTFCLIIQFENRVTCIIVLRTCVLGLSCSHGNCANPMLYTLVTWAGTCLLHSTSQKYSHTLIRGSGWYWGIKSGKKSKRHCCSNIITSPNHMTV